MKQWVHGRGHGLKSIDSDFEDDDVFEIDPNDFRYTMRPIFVPYLRPRTYYNHHHRSYYPRPYYKPMWREEAFEEFGEE